GPLQIENTTVCYAMLDAGTDNYASVVKDYDELGNTGSTFIARTFADGKMRYLLPLRFDENAAFNEVDSKTVEIINKSNQEDVIDFKDYRGQEVVAAVRGVPQTDWKMVVKIDKAEIFATLNRARNISYVILAITIIAMAGIAWLFSRIITGPISYFTQTVNQIKAGDLSKRVNIKNKDEIGELAGTFNDMTEKMQFAYRSLKQNTIEAQKEKRILQALLDNLPVGVLVVTAPSGEPLMMNRAGQLISGRQAPSGITSQQYTTAYDVLREDGSPYPTEELPLTVTLKTGRTVMKDNIVLRRPDGSTVAVSAISAPIKEADGTFQRAVSVFEDITEKRNLERSRDEFFSIASHELRTPLTAIRGNTDLIQRYFGEKLTDPDLKEMIDDIHESSVRLIEIVNDFLDTSRLEQKRMKFSPAPFDVVTMAEDAIRQYQVTSSRKQILLHVQKPASAMPLVYADQNRCRQVLINLVGNALKFTEKGSVTVSFKTEGDSVKVFVADTGQGIPYDAQSRLFRKFEQAGSTVLTRDSVRGTGLGLYISRMIMEQMKGGIKLESSVPGKGTTFSFTLPAARELTKSPAAPGRGDGLSFTKPLSII
ncbi:HAMP domain-containing protein, partial [Candidatus Saccharibacteria bacterium]|nr:HAMP domain-containing protein [Candidatus Saccharibacteria bacterium]